jgi:DNA-binding MarR family transcriptional regulator
MCNACFMSRPASSADHELASTIALEIRTVFRKVKLHLRDQGKHGDLTSSQISVVHRLEEGGPTTVSSLARAEGMRPQSMSAVMTPLQQAGLVGGMPDPNDGRQTLMSLTPKCLKWLREGRAARQDWLARRISERLSIHEQEKLRATLGLLRKLTED